LVASSYNGTEVYLDDILVYGDTPQEYLDNPQNPGRIQGVWCAAVSEEVLLRVPEEYGTRATRKGIPSLTRRSSNASTSLNPPLTST
jgi:hypothetical protein